MWENVSGNIRDVEWVATAMEQGTAVVASDGSFNPKQSTQVCSAGWIVYCCKTKGESRAVCLRSRSTRDPTSVNPKIDLAYFIVSTDLACYVADMSPTRVNVAKSWPTLRVVATQKRPRHTQFISITTDKYKSAQTYGYLSYHRVFVFELKQQS